MVKGFLKRFTVSCVQERKYDYDYTDINKESFYPYITTSHAVV